MTSVGRSRLGSAGKTLLGGLVSIGVMIASSGAAWSETIHFKFALTGAEETPSTGSKGTGHGTGVYDDQTHLFKYRISFKNLTGPATAAHFHGPAKEGEAADVTVPITGPTPLTSPIEGTATLNGSQAQQLIDGLWYFNIHTAAHPKGEIRGQVKKLSAIGKTIQNATGHGGGLPKP